MTRPALKIVTPAPAVEREEVWISDLHLAEIKRRDWGRVHIASDRNPPLSVWPRPWRWSNPRPRTQWWRLFTV